MRIAAALFATLSVSLLATAARAVELKVGDAAPAFEVGKWVQGEPVKSLEKGKVYVIECWATWCGPCRATIPHLNELSKEHKDVTFIGVDIWEDDESKVEPFVKQMGEKMTYRVALDEKSKVKEGAIAKNWMQAAGRNGIPSAFIIDKDSKIAWMGHPAAMDKVLSEIVGGTFDPKVEAAREAAEQALQNAVQEKVIAPLRAKKYDEALAAIDELAKANPDKAGNLRQMKVAVLLQKKDLAAAYPLMDEMASAKETNPDMLAGMASAVMTQQVFAANRDLERAMKWAQMAVDSSKEKNADALSTLARAHGMKGNFDKAAELQQKAVDAAPADEKDELKKGLESYKKKQVPPTE